MNLLLLVKLVILMMLVAGESGNFVEYGNFDDSGESYTENLVSHFLDIRFCGHSNFHFFTNIVSLKIQSHSKVRFFFLVQKQ